MDYLNCSFQKSTISLVLAFLIYTFSYAQNSIQQQVITNQYDNHELQELIEVFNNEVKQTASALIKLKAEKQMPSDSLGLVSFGSDGAPLFYDTYNAMINKIDNSDALYTRGISSLNLSGFGMKVGIWDSGIARMTHQEFEQRIQRLDDAVQDNHATMVTGAIISSGIKQNAKGVAFMADVIGYDWHRDKLEATKAIANGLLLSNHSYGLRTQNLNDWYFGAYIKMSQDWDKIMFNAPYYLMVTAAGNAQNLAHNAQPNFGKTSDSFDLLTGFATSKNGLVVAGALAEVDYTNELIDGKVTSYSSFGPTDDGRIKPDLAGEGALINTTSSNSDTSYDTFLGTSLAAPGVTGSLLLLQEYHEQLYTKYMKAATLKGLVLHTAYDVQKAGPDYKLGWGVINTKNAAETIKNKDFRTLILEENLAQNQEISLNIKATGEAPLIASISWTDAIGEYINQGVLNETTPALTNDLDIRITKNETTFYPWKLNPDQATDAAEQGDNKVDPFERIDIPDAIGDYTLTISHKGNLSNGSQNFSLIVSGVQLTSCKLETPQGFKITSTKNNVIELEWHGQDEDTLYELQTKTEGEENWQTHTLSEPNFVFKNLYLDTRYLLRVRTICSQNITSTFSDEVHFVFDGESTQLELGNSNTDDEKRTFKIFPNPVMNDLYLDSGFSKKAPYYILTTSGLAVKRGIIKEYIKVGDLPTGVYILIVQENGVLKSSKFFKY